MCVSGVVVKKMCSEWATEDRCEYKLFNKKGAYVCYCNGDRCNQVDQAAVQFPPSMNLNHRSFASQLKPKYSKHISV
jgi:hypothetical protein